MLFNRAFPPEFPPGSLPESPPGSLPEFPPDFLPGIPEMTDFAEGKPY